MSIDKEEVKDRGSFDILLSGLCDFLICFLDASIHYRVEAVRGGDCSDDPGDPGYIIEWKLLEEVTYSDDPGAHGAVRGGDYSDDPGAHGQSRQNH